MIFVLNSLDLSQMLNGSTDLERPDKPLKF